MKQNSHSQSLRTIIAIVILTLTSYPLFAQEKVVFDETVDWSWPLPQTYGGNSFYWWHRIVDGYNINNLGEMPSDNWKSPADYENGTFYLRVEVISQPTSNPFTIQLGIWQDIGKSGGHSECISSGVSLSGGSGSVQEATLGHPNDWWEIRTDAPVDYTRPEDFHRIGLILWKGSTECIPMAQGWTNAQQCGDAATQQANFFPMQVRITLVACASGTSFSGWSNYSGGGSTRHPTPNYSIDYTNERTSTVVPSTDEYSTSSNMSGAVSGNGTAINLSPGQDVYFRTKASGEILASLVQTLDVPSRPSAPTFAYDAANERTSTTVSNQYEYSSSSDMSGAITGSGSYVDFAPGTTRYFRKKATASAFKSSVQTLTGTSEPPTGDHEFAILNATIDFPNSTDNNGFYFFYYNATMPSNWVAPFDYFHGQVYTRYEIISEKTSEDVGLQFGIWQKLPPETGTLYENMEPVRTLTGPGDVVISNSSPSSWWAYNGGADFTQMNLVWHFGINPYQVTPSQQQIRSENADVWAVRNDKWFPMKVRVIVVAVASGYSFSGWDNYINAGGVPNYQIDYGGEQTTTNMSSEDEFSYNQSAWTSGNNAKLALTPGQDVYIRHKASPGEVQLLDVPARPSAPSFAIDYVNERTTATVGSDYEYTTHDGMSGASPGTGTYVTLVPGFNTYFRKLSTSSAFKSAIQTLTVPDRQAATAYTIDFVNGTTMESVPSTVEYSNFGNFSPAVSGTGTVVPVSAGTVMYFRKKATASLFKSATQVVSVPAKPAAPTFAINYTHERTTTTVTADYEYSSNPDMTDSQTGVNTVVRLTPGVDVYFIKKGTYSSFSSQIQHLVVPERPASPSVTIDFAAEKTAENISESVGYASNSNFSNASAGTNAPVTVVPGQTLYFRMNPAEGNFASTTTTVIAPARPVISCELTGPTSITPIPVSIEFPSAVSGIESSDLLVTNGTVSAITGSYDASITPAASGVVTVTVKPNAAAEGNFESEPFSIEFTLITNVSNTEIKGLTIYPTVAREYLNIDSKDCTGCSFRIYNVEGISMLNGTIRNNKEEIDIKSLVPGSYYIVINKDEKAQTLKFIRSND